MFVGGLGVLVLVKVGTAVASVPNVGVAGAAAVAVSVAGLVDVDVSTLLADVGDGVGDNTSSTADVATGFGVRCKLALSVATASITCESSG